MQYEILDKNHSEALYEFTFRSVAFGLKKIECDIGAVVSPIASKKKTKTKNMQFTAHKKSR